MDVGRVDGDAASTEPRCHSRGSFLSAFDLNSLKRYLFVLLHVGISVGKRIFFLSSGCVPSYFGTKFRDGHKIPWSIIIKSPRGLIFTCACCVVCVGDGP
jgi:hypothetical protein